MRTLHSKLLIFLATVFLIPYSFSVAAVADNPTVYFKAANNAVAPGSEFMVEVLVESPTPINAIALEVNYPVKNLELLRVDNSQSVINIWRGSPLVDTSGTIRIEGGLSKPFVGSGGTVVNLYFMAKDTGLASLSFKDIGIYYADGTGTRAKVNNLPISISISSDALPVALDPKEDATGPVISEISIIKDSITQVPLAVFNVADRESGVGTAEIRWREWLFWSDWKPAQNPIPLSKQAWIIQIKATDIEGNSTLQTVYVKENVTKKIFYIVFLLVAVIAISVCITYMIFKNKRTNV